MNNRRASRPPIPDPKSILAVSVSGIGNTILATPLLRALRLRFPKARLDLLVWGGGGAAPLRGSGVVDEIWVAPRSLAAWPGFLLRLRRHRYDVALTVFPSNRPAFHLFNWLAGARNRLSHAYRGGWKRLEWLESHRVPAREELHDVDQNLALLGAFGLDASGENRTPFFHVPDEDRRAAADWLRQIGAEGKRPIGFHPGAGSAAGKQRGQGLWKRWPKERFAELVRRLSARDDSVLLLFGGPEEEPLKQEVARLAGQPANLHSVQASLPQTAALLERCAVVVTNDSGLMHVAAAVGAQVVALFGPTQPARTAPMGPGHRILRKDGPGRPCLRYPFHTSSSKIRCACQGECLRDIHVDEVRDAALAVLEGDSP